MSAGRPCARRARHSRPCRRPRAARAARRRGSRSFAASWTRRAPSRPGRVHAPRRDLDARGAAVHEVELVLAIVKVVEAVVVRRIDDGVDPERGDAERTAHLAKPEALAELVDRPERVSHGVTLSDVAASGQHRGGDRDTAARLLLERHVHTLAAAARARQRRRRGSARRAPRRTRPRCGSGRGRASATSTRGRARPARYAIVAS